MYKTENIFKSFFIERLEKEKYECERIESGETACGIPDVYFSSPYAKGWAELKNMKKIGTDSVNIPFRPRQYAWLRRFSKKGTLCVLMVAHDGGVAVFCNKDIKPVYSINEFIQASIALESRELTDILEGAYNEQENNRPGMRRVHSISNVIFDPISGYINEAECTHPDPGDITA